MKKNVILGLLAILLTFSLIGCGGDNAATTGSKDDSVSPSSYAGIWKSNEYPVRAIIGSDLSVVYEGVKGTGWEKIAKGTFSITGNNVTIELTHAWNNGSWSNAESDMNNIKSFFGGSLTITSTVNGYSAGSVMSASENTATMVKHEGVVTKADIVGTWASTFESNSFTFVINDNGSFSLTKDGDSSWAGWVGSSYAQYGDMKDLILFTANVNPNNSQDDPSLGIFYSDNKLLAPGSGNSMMAFTKQSAAAKTLEVQNLPADGNYILWLGTVNSSNTQNFYSNIAAATQATVTNGAGIFVLKTADEGFLPTSTNWSGNGNSFYVSMMVTGSVVSWGSRIAFSITSNTTTINYDNTWVEE